MTKQQKSFIWRLAPAIILLLIIIIFFASGLHKSFNFDQLAINYAKIDNYVSQNPLLAPLIAIMIYISATALSFPLAWLLSVSIGLIFGWVTAFIIVLIGATIGASILFLLAQYSFADFFKAKSSKLIKKIAKNFQNDAASYLLFLRLVPLFPFTLVNVVPAILGVKFFTFVWTTALGIIPGVIAYTYAGEGLRSIIIIRANACLNNIPPCGQSLASSDLVTKEIIIAISLLGVISLIPILLKTFRPKKWQEK